MRPVLLPEEAAELDERSRARGVTADALMEAAGREVADAALRLLGGAYGRRGLVVCGKGNNGGDGLVAARYLDRAGVRTTVLLLDEGAREPAATNLRRLEATGVRRRPFSSAAIERELERADVAVDAIFGTGFRGSPEGASAAAIRARDTAGGPAGGGGQPAGGDRGAARPPRAPPRRRSGRSTPRACRWSRSTSPRG